MSDREPTDNEMRFGMVMMQAQEQGIILRLDEVALRAGLSHDEGVEAMNGFRAGLD